MSEMSAPGGTLLASATPATTTDPLTHSPCLQVVRRRAQRRKSGITSLLFGENCHGCRRQAGFSGSFPTCEFWLTGGSQCPSRAGRGCRPGASVLGPPHGP